MKRLVYLLLAVLVVSLSSCGGTPTPTGDFSLTLAAANITISRGSSGDITITVNKNNGFSDLVTYSISSVLPNGVTATFNPVSHADGSVLTLDISATATAGTKAVTITGVGDGKTHTASFNLTINAVPDTTKPTIVDYSPADGRRGVLADTKIIIKFSEPMNQQAAQAAFQSSDIGAHTFNWDDNGKTMIVTPSSPLAYSPNTAYKTYHFKITTTAQDRAGNNLTGAESVQFSTMRTHQIYFRANKALDGYVWDNNGNVYEQNDYIRVGDQAAGNRYARGFLSFDIGAYLSSKHAVGIKKAIVGAFQYLKRGNPYSDLKGSILTGRYLRIYHMSYGSTLDKADFVRTPLSRRSIEFSKSFSTGYKKVNVTSWVSDDYSNRRGRDNRSQFRLQFAKNTDLDGHDDHVEFFSGNHSDLNKVPILWVWYYAP